MDIGNMHPFCLPFGLCHDATSSIISVTDNSSNGRDNDKQRSRTCSPSEELFTQLNDHSICRSILDHDTIIDSSSLIDDDATFRSLELALDQDHGTDDSETFHYSNDDFDENISISNNQSGLLSPISPPGYCQRIKRRKLSTQTGNALANNHHLHHHHHQHNVFHEIDPIDIKSSPTLAQLNLNSNDDQNDGLWDTTSTRLHPPTITDLIASSNCTSIHAGSKCTSTSVCNNMHQPGHILHLHHHHHHPQHNNHNLYSSTSSHNSTNITCQHLNSQRLQDSNYKINSALQSHLQGTCLTVPPIRKSVLDLNNCCNHHILMVNNQGDDNDTCNSNHINDNCNLRNSASLNQANHLHDSSELIQGQGNSARAFSTNMSGDKSQLVVNNRSMSQRSASPALVTSSSSPLSSFLSGISNNSKDDRVIDNRLKENIDYLTALLCNGHKIECSNTSQQPIISSTMVKSYSALAHTLSTGPKLLERPSTQNPTVADDRQQKLAIDPPNEVNTCRQNAIGIANDTHLTGPFEQQQQHQQLICGNQQQWSKQAIVESSVSAADSTESQVTSQIMGVLDETNNNRVINATSVGSVTIMNTAKSLEISTTNATTASYSSTLLTTDSRCTNTVGTGFKDTTNSCLRHQLTMNSANSSTCTKPKILTSSFPQNGKPITLTPIASNNSILVTQQQHSTTSQRTPLFAQPASPSSSASSGNAEIGSSSSSSMSMPKFQSSKKRPISNQSMRGANPTGGSDRSGRPNSLSTDCSLSSHDEGFASQMDNEDCGSNKDSDDDDDSDSDDESFYGDYTNNDLIGASISDDPENKWTLNMGRTRRNGQKRFFWQYNVQSKGPKGTRICSSDNPEDPFVLPEASDPVFSNDCQVEGVKHSGKARRGDGNDLTPNPRKLLMIGLELKKLSKVINELAPVTDLPLNARNTTRKEKNKLASRACRLKKKAQHEANKIKLYGLQREHQQVVMAIFDARKLMSEKLKQMENNSENGEPVFTSNDDAKSISSQIDSMAKQCSMVVAGQTSDYVNSVLEKVVSGCIDGGLQT